MAGMGARALYTWFTLLIFVIMITLRLNHSMQVSWFVVFIPLWLYELIMVVSISIKACKKAVGSGSAVFEDHHCLFFLWDMFGIICLFTFEMFLCLKLDGTWNIQKAHILFAPLWILCVQCLLKLGWHVYEFERSHDRTTLLSTSRSL